MNKQEKELLLELARFFSADTEKLTALVPQGATAAVLGQLFYNRTAAIAYDVLRSSGLLGKLNREFRNSLEGAYLQSLERNQSFTCCLDMLNEALQNCKGKYAMLKGAMLCSFCPKGHRTSNDIDLLVAPDDVSIISEALTAAGFQQGHIRNGGFVPATRKEIVTSKMTRGETVPFIKEVRLPFMPYLEVDINFSLDYKNSDSTVITDMLQRSVGHRVNNHVKIQTLEEKDFFIHLCAHLYKEATTLPWVKMNRDLTLYKFVDIYMQLCIFMNNGIDALFSRAAELGMAEICSCVILWTEALLPAHNTYAVEVARKHLAGKEYLLDLVVAPAEKKEYRYVEQDICERFFAPDRTTLLEEV